MTVSSAPARLRPFEPRPFGRYTLLLPIATGGMGEVLLARLEGGRGLEKLCVIKRILPSHAQRSEFVERFVNEARTLVQLSHGSIAQVLDMGVLQGQPYMALEYVDGKDLRRVVARVRDTQKELPLGFILHVACKVLDALSYAHRKRGTDNKEMGLVHRDISPQNILVSYDGEVKIIDFGLVKSALNVADTHPSVVLGKFWYMSPEQAQNQTIDFRSDIYSLGMCLYEWIAGKNPFTDISSGALLEAVAQPKITPLSEVVPSCPQEVCSAIMKALEPDVSRRFSSAQAFRQELEKALFSLGAASGPEVAGEFLRQLFSADFENERRMLASLQKRAAPTQGASEEAPKTLADTQVVMLDEVQSPTSGMSRAAVSDTLVQVAPTTDMAQTGIHSNPFHSSAPESTPVTQVGTEALPPAEQTAVDLPVVSVQKTSRWPFWAFGLLLVGAFVALWILTWN